MTFTACVPAELRFRDLVGDVVRSVCRHVEAAQRCDGLEWRVMSAFNEAFNNVAEHGYTPPARGTVEVVIRVDAARLVVEISDEGQGFDYAARAQDTLAPIEELDRGGMGLFIMREAMSRVRYERGPRNRLTMEQDLAACRASTRGAPGENDEGSRC